MGGRRLERLGRSAVAGTVALALVYGLVASKFPMEQFTARRRTAGGVPS